MAQESAAAILAAIADNGAGIGGGYESSGATVVINGGSVTASGFRGIGAGESNDDNGTLTLAEGIRFGAGKNADDIDAMGDSSNVSVAFEKKYFTAPYVHEHKFSKQVVDDKYLKSEAKCEEPAVYFKSCFCGEASTTETFKYGKPIGHNWDEGEIIQEPKCATAGLKQYHCTRCEETKNEFLEPLGHNFVGGICSRCGGKRCVSVTMYDEEIGFTSIEEAFEIGGGRGWQMPIKLEADGLSYTLPEYESIFLDLNGKKVKINTPKGCTLVKEPVQDGITMYFSAVASDLDWRIAGSNRYETAMDIADTVLLGEKTKCFVVANGSSYPDALAGGYLAAFYQAPLVLVDSSNEAAIANYIKENLREDGQIYILGGEGVVSKKFESKCRTIAPKVTRLGGKDRYETNMKILKEARVDTEDLLICSGTGYADSLSASAAGKPIFLVGDSLTKEQKTYLAGLNTGRYYAIGGTGAVSDKVFNEVCGTRSGAEKQRVFGMNRYETSAAVAREFFPNPRHVVLAYAQNFPDGLAGSALANAYAAPLLLTDNSKTGVSIAKGYVENTNIWFSFTLGGKTLISDSSRDTIMGR